MNSDGRSTGDRPDSSAETFGASSWASTGPLNPVSAWQGAGALEVEMLKIAEWYKRERGPWMVNPLWWLAITVHFLLTLLCRDWRAARTR